MAFPGTYNINYYKGDTFEFRIYPKDSSGAQFSLNDFSSSRFTISNVLGDQVSGGPTKQTINGYATKVNNQYILCVITPDNGSQMVAGTTYYYDVEIGKPSTPYDYVYTLLQGTISVAEQTTPPLPLPSAPRNITASSITQTSAVLSWAAPISGTVDSYNIYIVVGGIPVNKLATVPASATSLPASPLAPGTTYTIGITAENLSGEGPMATVTATTLS